MGGLIGGFVGAIVAFLTSSSFLLTIPLAAIIGAFFFTLLLVRPELVDVAPLWGAFFGGLGGLFLTSDPMFPALMAVAGACAGTSLPANLEPTEETDQTNDSDTEPPYFQ
jgi:hypothetical protein